MEITGSKFSIWLLFLLFIFSLFFSQKTVSINYNGEIFPVLTHERTIQDVLKSQSIYIYNLPLNKTIGTTLLREGMGIEINHNAIIINKE